MNGTITVSTQNKDVLSTLEMKLLKALWPAVFAIGCVLIQMSECGPATILLKLIRFNNEDGAIDIGNCCDGFFLLCPSECDHQLEICLDLPTGLDTMNICTYGRFKLDEVTDENEIIFGTRIGVEKNPLVFHASEWRGGVKIKIDIWDVDGPSSFEFVDFIVLPHFVASPKSEFDAVFEAITIRDRVRLDAEIKVFCDDDYYGRNCDIFCADDCSGTQYSCNTTNGAKVCNEDYFDVDCDVFCNTNSGVINGNYLCDSSTGLKICSDNYYGPGCDVFCDQNPSFSCDNNGTQVCAVDYYGPSCDIFCEDTDDVTGHYTCDSQTGTKICNSGWSGQNCDRGEGGTCVQPQCTDVSPDLATDISVSCSWYQYEPENLDNCCGVTSSDGQLSYCCGFIINAGRDGENIACCGMHKYDIAMQTCCSPAQLQPSFGSAATSCCKSISYNTNTHICCNGQISREIAGSRTLCCGSHAYDPIVEMCCGTELQDIGTPCCGGIVFNRRTKICCKGRVLRRRSVRQCCGRAAYTPGSQLCCDGIRRKNNDAQTLSCCGTRTYQPSREKCCSSIISAVSGVLMNYVKCCDTQAYDTRQQTCCNNIINNKLFFRAPACCGNTLYDIRTAICCDGVVTSGRNEFTGCCGQTSYDRRFQECCGVTLLTTSEMVDTGCCKDVLYTRATHVCCGGVIHEKPDPVNSACCGLDAYDTRFTLCCGGIAQQRLGWYSQCCHREVIDVRRNTCAERVVKLL